MNKEQFWNIIDTARESGGSWTVMLEPLQDALAKLEPQEIAGWYNIFSEYHAIADQELILGAAIYINNGISDDGFIDFRSWLIAQGKEAYFNALLDPDSLAGLQAIRNFFAEVRATEYEPLNGYFNRPKFEAMIYAPLKAFEQKCGTAFDFYAYARKYQLKAQEATDLRSEIRFARNIDYSPRHRSSRSKAQQEYAMLFPRLTAALDKSNTLDAPSAPDQASDTTPTAPKRRQRER